MRSHPVDQQALLAQGAVGDVCHRFFDADGRLVASDIDARVVGIAPDELPRDPTPGRPGRWASASAEPIRAAILGGWVNVVVTDLATARDLLAA